MQVQVRRHKLKKSSINRGQPSSKIRYYHLTDNQAGKKISLKFEHFAEFLRLLPEEADSNLSWTADMDEWKRARHRRRRPHAVR